MNEIASLHYGVTMSLEVGCDGPSLPILTITIREKVGERGSRRTSFIMLNKDQTDELTRTLQSLVTEM